MISKKFNIAIYERDVFVYISNNKRQIEKKIQLDEGTLYDGSDASTFSIVNDNNVRDMFMVFDENVSIGTIAHECKHTINFLYKDLGVKLDIDNDEHECYLLGWLIDEILIWKNGTCKA